MTENLLYAVMALAASSVILLVAVIVLLIKGAKGKDDGGIEATAESVNILKDKTDTDKAQILTELKAQSELGKERIDNACRLINQGLSVHRDSVDKATENQNVRMDKLYEIISVKLDNMAQSVDKKVSDLEKSNLAQLEKMRETVDEKLSSTLESRFRQSFTMVEQRLEAITKGFGEMQGLTSGMSDLKKILTNVKTRGTWGEVSLDNLLSQILTGEQYVRNFRPDKREDGLVVDFAIALPGKDSDKTYLPMDAKFPTEDYQRIIDAKDAEGQESARKSLVARLKAEAQSVKTKYIRPPKTTDFAIMYLPTEGLFAEVMQIPGLSDEIQNRYRVIICGPTTVAALLNSLQMGFKTVAIEKRSSEIWKLLAQFRKDFGKFCELLEKTQTQLKSIDDTISRAAKRSDLIQRRLKSVEDDTAELLGESASDKETDYEL